MKKNLFFISVAALALGACTSDNVVEENNSVKQPKEIAIQAIATPNTRAAVTGTSFPEIPMKVAAYDVTLDRDLFGATTFSKDATTWKGGKYWPFATTTINFLAIANANSDNATGVTWGVTDANYASKVVVAMADNRTAQRDLMYAIGTGNNSSSFPTIPMEFKHAQAWVKFNVKAGNTTSATAITVNSITLNSVSCQGTYTVTQTNFDQATGQVAAGAWSDYASNAGNVTLAPSFTLSTSGADFGDLMVVPNQGMASFTINYTIDGKTYDYTYSTSSTALAQATKYTYNITLTVHEIEVAPTVADWTEGGPVAINL
jgi:hypothetical protein